MEKRRRFLIDLSKEIPHTSYVAKMREQIRREVKEELMSSLEDM
jgi:hypothetical protein